MNKLIAMTFLVAVSVSGEANARDPASSVFKATRLDEQLVGARKACEANELAGDIESISAANPSMFYGINPESEDWPDARSAYLRYATSTCVPRNEHDYAELATSFYENTLSKEEMSAVLRFYDSPIGKKFAEVSLRLSSKLNQKMYEESRKVREEGGMRFDAEMKEISVGRTVEKKKAGAIKPISIETKD